MTQPAATFLMVIRLRNVGLRTTGMLIRSPLAASIEIDLELGESTCQQCLKVWSGLGRVAAGVVIVLFFAGS